MYQKSMTPFHNLGNYQHKWLQCLIRTPASEEQTFSDQSCEIVLAQNPPKRVEYTLR